jgi:hypothetical protein
MLRAMFWDNPAFVQEEELLRRMHLLNAQGKGESDEADAIAEASEEPWNKLSPEERARINGMSAALHMLSGEEVYEKTELSQEQLRAALTEAWQRGDAVQVLSLLRKGPAFLKAYEVAYYRSVCYHALGHVETARLFHGHADKLAADAGAPQAVSQFLMTAITDLFNGSARKGAAAKAMPAA